MLAPSGIRQQRCNAHGDLGSRPAPFAVSRRHHQPSLFDHRLQGILLGNGRCRWRGIARGWWNRRRLLARRIGRLYSVCGGRKRTSCGCGGSIVAVGFRYCAFRFCRCFTPRRARRLPRAHLRRDTTGRRDPARAWGLDSWGRDDRLFVDANNPHCASPGMLLGIGDGFYLVGGVGKDWLGRPPLRPHSAIFQAAKVRRTCTGRIIAKHRPMLFHGLRNVSMLSPVLGAAPGGWRKSMLRQSRDTKPNANFVSTSKPTRMPSGARTFAVGCRCLE